MKIRAGHSKLVTLGLLLFCMCLSANLAYGMGGGAATETDAGTSPARLAPQPAIPVLLISGRTGPGALGAVALTFSAL